MDNLLDESLVNSVIERQKSNDTPLEKDKIQLLKLIQKLTKQDHIKIFDILQKLDKKIYTTNEKETLFDINDLKTDSFWELFLYVVLSYRNNIKANIITKAEIEKKENEKIFHKKIDDDLKNHIHNNAIDNDRNIPEYEELRVKALASL